MSATHTEPIVNWSLLDIRIESRFWPTFRFVELSTFMTALPAPFTNARRSLDAWLPLRKLGRAAEEHQSARVHSAMRNWSGEHT